MEVVEEGVEDEVGFDGEHPKIKCPNLFNKLFFCHAVHCLYFLRPRIVAVGRKTPSCNDATKGVAWWRTWRSWKRG